MSYHYYTKTGRPRHDHDLPSLEVFQNQYSECEECGHAIFDTFGDWDECPECWHTRDSIRHTKVKTGYFWWARFPGCMPDSDPFGPFSSYSEALKDAREGVWDS